MSFDYTDRAWAVSLENHTAKIVLLRLAYHANEEGVCWPSQSTIAHYCGMTRETVIRNLKKLRSLKLLKVLQTTGSSNRYQLMLPVTETHTSKLKEVTKKHTPGDSPSHPPVTKKHTPGDSPSHPPVTLRHTNSQKNRPRKVKGKTTGARASARTGKSNRLHPSTHKVLTEWGKRYKDQFGRTYVERTTDEKLVNALLSAGIKADEFIRIAILAWQALAKGGGFICKQSITIHGLCEHWNELVMVVEPKKRKPEQDNGNRYDEHATFSSRVGGTSH